MKNHGKILKCNKKEEEMRDRKTNWVSKFFAILGGIYLIAIFFCIVMAIIYRNNPIQENMYTSLFVACLIGRISSVIISIFTETIGK